MVQTFPKGICLKVNVIVQLVFELIMTMLKFSTLAIMSWRPPFYFDIQVFKAIEFANK